MENKLLLGLGGLGVILLLALALPLSALSAEKGPEITTKGYSIFDETIVDMTWQEIEKAAKEKAIIILPTAVIEEHGPHMSIGVDTYLGYTKSKLVRRELEARGIKTIIAPPFYWGINNASASFPGSFVTRPETMKALISDIMASLKRWGFTNVFVINWHGDADHNIPLMDAIRQARVDCGIRAYYVTSEPVAKRFGLTGKEYYVIIEKSAPRSGPPPKYINVHADETETGAMLSYFPNQVNEDLAKKLEPTNLVLKDLIEWRRGWDDGKRITPLGYFGAPAGYDKKAAKEDMESGAKAAADVIELWLKGEYKAPKIE